MVWQVLYALPAEIDTRAGRSWRKSNYHLSLACGRCLWLGLLSACGCMHARPALCWLPEAQQAANLLVPGNQQLPRTQPCGPLQVSTPPHKLCVQRHPLSPTSSWNKPDCATMYLNPTPRNLKAFRFPDSCVRLADAWLETRSPAALLNLEGVYEELRLVDGAQRSLLERLDRGRPLTIPSSPSLSCGDDRGVWTAPTESDSDRGTPETWAEIHTPKREHSQATRLPSGTSFGTPSPRQ